MMQCRKYWRGIPFPASYPAHRRTPHNFYSSPLKALSIPCRVLLLYSTFWSIRECLHKIPSFSEKDPLKCLITMDSAGSTGDEEKVKMGGGYRFHYDCSVILEVKGDSLREYEECQFWFQSNKETRTVKAIIIDKDDNLRMRGTLRKGGQEVLMGQIMAADDLDPQGNFRFELHFCKEGVAYEYMLTLGRSVRQRFIAEVDSLVADGFISPIVEMEDDIKTRQVKLEASELRTADEEERGEDKVMTTDEEHEHGDLPKH